MAEAKLKLDAADAELQEAMNKWFKAKSTTKDGRPKKFNFGTLLKIIMAIFEAIKGGS